MRTYKPDNLLLISKIVITDKTDLMKFSSSTQNWAEKKRKFQMAKLNMLVAIKESYERKLAGISAAISKLEDQMNMVDVTNENWELSFIILDRIHNFV